RQCPGAAGRVDRLCDRLRTHAPAVPILHAAVPVRLPAAVLLLLGARTLGAQTAVVYGRATDSGGVPLEYVRVQVSGTALADLTHPDGGYRIAGVSPGTIAVRARRVGFVPGRYTVSVVTGDSVWVR